jgi:PPK2 family polyphosphate:nucleotide phosphotransferase
MQINADETLKVPLTKKVNLQDYDPDWMPSAVKEVLEKRGKKEAKEKALTIVEANRQKLSVLQELFWANESHALLIILQGMDSAGKDSIIRHVMSGLNPQGCEVEAFKTPTAEEENHDFLWRYSKVLPERGRIGIFNRSYYEDVLIVKVRPEMLNAQKLPEPVDKIFWKQRYEDINAFEQHLTRNGTIILKFFLNMSKKRQKQRLLKRLNDPNKRWKFSLTDLSEREKWPKYMDAYNDVLNHTNTVCAPWYVIPADKKWVTHATISEIIVSHIECLNLKYPVFDAEQEKAFEKAKAILEQE